MTNLFKESVQLRDYPFHRDISFTCPHTLTHTPASALLDHYVLFYLSYESRLYFNVVVLRWQNPAGTWDHTQQRVHCVNVCVRLCECVGLWSGLARGTAVTCSLKLPQIHGKHSRLISSCHSYSIQLRGSFTAWQHNYEYPKTLFG